MNKKELAEIYDLANDTRYSDRYVGYEVVAMCNKPPYKPKAGVIVDAFANYRLSHPLVRWYYKIKEVLNWRINIKLYKGD